MVNMKLEDNDHKLVEGTDQDLVWLSLGTYDGKKLRLDNHPLNLSVKESKGRDYVRTHSRLMVYKVFSPERWNKIRDNSLGEFIDSYLDEFERCQEARKYSELHSLQDNWNVELEGGGIFTVLGNLDVEVYRKYDTRGRSRKYGSLSFNGVPFKPRLKERKDGKFSVYKVMKEETFNDVSDKSFGEFLDGALQFTDTGQEFKRLERSLLSD